MQTQMKDFILRSSLFLHLFFIPVFLSVQGKSFVILHFSDTHSRIEAMPPNSAYTPDKGGAVRWDSYIQKVRKEAGNVLVFHSGDMVQGTPYFTVFGGEVEIAVANRIKIDAACPGNHEFDNGLEFLAKMIRRAQYPYLTTNLDLTGTPLEGLTKKYLVIKRKGVKIGVIGITINPDGLVAKKNSEGVAYLDPIASANETAALLKKEQKCDVVICLSHLGYYPNEEAVGDITLAKNSRNIDIILGGHTHLAFPEPVRQLNLDGQEVIITQPGAYGVYVGRLDVELEKR
jgi:5'-nucleotidase